MNLSPENKAKLDALEQKLIKKSDTMLGYPLNKNFDYSELYPFFKYSINNVGDPYENSNLGTNTFAFEREVLDYFADLFHAPKNEWWGYVTHGGSEGNLYGLYLARECYPKGMVYYPETTHYSVKKNLRLLNMPAITTRTQENGEVNYEDLRRCIEINRHLPVIIFANHGTTMTEAKDNIEKIKSILNDLLITDYYIHVDAALSGMISPFLENRPNFDFEAGIDSISVSGHKFLGSPVPSGVVVAKKRNRDRVANTVDYISSIDTTIAGSRNGISPLILWYAINSLGKEGAKNMVNSCLEIAEYAENKLNEIGIKAWRNTDAITVVIPKLPQDVLDEFQLATQGDICHLIVMPDVTKKKVDDFLEVLKLHLVHELMV